jgi:acyl-coenzyme A synthetase/AMP-(fatty) acid ligase
MNACFFQSETQLEKWRTLLLASLDVSAVPVVDTGLRWFPEYSIDAYNNLITRHLPLARNKPCLKTFDKAGNSATYTYGEVDALVRIVVEKLNLPPGGKLAVIGEPSIETATLVLASAFLGCHHTVVMPTLPPDSISARLELFEPNLVITPLDWSGAGVSTRRLAQKATLRITANNVWINEALCVDAIHASSLLLRQRGHRQVCQHLQVSHVAFTISKISQYGNRRMRRWRGCPPRM